MPRIQKMGKSQYMITLPQKLRKAMGWEKGDNLEFKVQGSQTLEITQREK